VRIDDDRISRVDPGQAGVAALGQLEAAAIGAVDMEPEFFAAGEDGEIELVFPTIKNLEALAAFGSTDELLEWAQGRSVEPVEPRVVVEGEVARIIMPGEPGYRA
jgi:hypothetical protein